MWVIRNKNIFLVIAGLVIAVTLGIIATFGLQLGIDFTGGALTEVAYNARPDKAALESELDTLDLGGYSLRAANDDAGRDSYILRTRDLSDAERVTVEDTLTSAGDGAEVTRFTSVGPVIGEELKSKAVWAIAGVVLVIVLYVAFAFRGVSYPVGSWYYGGITILALIHDILVPTALISILGIASGVEIDILFIMALLAILGYSVNDTIVVFDRLRENLVHYRQEKKHTVKREFGQTQEVVEYKLTKPMADIAGEAIDQTIIRSINTSLTTALAVAALYVLGGSVTTTFALMLLAGIIAGTYSSIFFASPLLVWFAERQLAKENK